MFHRLAALVLSLAMGAPASMSNAALAQDPAADACGQ